MHPLPHKSCVLNRSLIYVLFTTYTTSPLTHLFTCLSKEAMHFHRICNLFLSLLLLKNNEKQHCKPRIIRHAPIQITATCTYGNTILYTTSVILYNAWPCQVIHVANPVQQIIHSVGLRPHTSHVHKQVQAAVINLSFLRLPSWTSVEAQDHAHHNLRFL